MGGTGKGRETLKKDPCFLEEWLFQTGRGKNNLKREEG